MGIFFFESDALDTPYPQLFGLPDTWNGDDMRSSEHVRRELLRVWGEQACRDPADWPRVLDRLMRQVSTDSGPRYSMRPCVDYAVRELSALGEIDAAAIWRVFPKLDMAHCERLAEVFRCGEVGVQ